MVPPTWVYRILLDKSKGFWYYLAQWTNQAALEDPGWLRRPAWGGSEARLEVLRASLGGSEASLGALDSLGVPEARRSSEGQSGSSEARLGALGQPGGSEARLGALDQPGGLGSSPWSSDSQGVPEARRSSEGQPGGSGESDRR
jgi:hypothetical protein